MLRRSNGWALIDPDGFIGERAYDLGVVMRDACRELAATELAQQGTALPTLERECHQLASLADIDPARVWQWAFVERVTTGLYLGWHGHTDESATFLDSATLLADSKDGAGNVTDGVHPTPASPADGLHPHAAASSCHTAVV